MRDELDEMRAKAIAKLVERWEAADQDTAADYVAAAVDLTPMYRGVLEAADTCRRGEISQQDYRRVVAEWWYAIRAAWDRVDADRRAA